MKKLQNITVFCASHIGNNPHYAEASARLGEILARQGRTLVYGGSNLGYMGVVSSAAIKAGGKVIGVMPSLFSDEVLQSQKLDELYVTQSMGERKDKMRELADGFIATPGGVGTLDEITDMLTSNQLGDCQKPIGILNVDGYFDHFIAQMERLLEEGLIYTGTFSTMIVSKDIEKLLRLMDDFVPAEVSDVAERLRHK